MAVFVPVLRAVSCPSLNGSPSPAGSPNIFKIYYAVVNVGTLDSFADNAEVTPETLAAAGLIPSARRPVKILGNGELSKPLVVRIAKCSASARSKIEAAGGRIEEPIRA